MHHIKKHKLFVILLHLTLLHVQKDIWVLILVFLIPLIALPTMPILIRPVGLDFIRVNRKIFYIVGLEIVLHLLNKYLKIYNIVLQVLFLIRLVQSRGNITTPIQLVFRLLLIVTRGICITTFSIFNLRAASMILI